MWWRVECRHNRTTKKPGKTKGRGEGESKEGEGKKDKNEWICALTSLGKQQKGTRHLASSLIRLSAPAPLPSNHPHCNGITFADQLPNAAYHPLSSFAPTLGELVN